MDKYDTLKLENQLCFPLYAASREIIKQYRPFLDEIGITYTQYVVMMVLWENRCISVKKLGEELYLDSGTLTPVLKSLADKGYITRKRCQKDERVLIVSLTEEGKQLREKAVEIPSQMAACVNVSKEEAEVLHKLLYKILERK
jgi:DNA-binding MarR family transcriptional regulator